MEMTLPSADPFAPSFSSLPFTSYSINSIADASMRPTLTTEAAEEQRSSSTASHSTEMAAKAAEHSAVSDNKGLFTIELSDKYHLALGESNGNVVINGDSDDARRKDLSFFEGNKGNGYNRCAVHRALLPGSQKDEASGKTVVNDKEGVLLQHLLPDDRRIRFKRDEFKNTTCVCQASRAMVRIKFELDEYKHLLEADRERIATEEQALDIARENHQKLQSEVLMAYEKNMEKALRLGELESALEEKDRKANELLNKVETKIKDLNQKMEENVQLELQYKESFRYSQERQSDIEIRESLFEEKQRQLEALHRQLYKTEHTLATNETYLNGELKRLDMDKEKLREKEKAISVEYETVAKEKREFEEKRKEEIHQLELDQQELQRLREVALKAQQETQRVLEEQCVLRKELNEGKARYEEALEALEVNRARIERLESQHIAKLKAVEQREMILAERQKETHHEKEMFTKWKEEQLNALKLKAVQFEKECEEERDALARSRDELETKEIEFYDQMKSGRQQLAKDLEGERNAFEKWKQSSQLTLEEGFKAMEKQKESMDEAYAGVLRESKDLEERSKRHIANVDVYNADKQKLEMDTAKLEASLQELEQRATLLDQKERALQPREAQIAQLEAQLSGQKSQLDTQLQKLQENQKIVENERVELFTRQAQIKEQEAILSQLRLQQEEFELEKNSFECEKRQQEYLYERRVQEFEAEKRRYLKKEERLTKREKLLKSKKDEILLKELVTKNRIMEEKPKMSSKPLLVLDEGEAEAAQPIAIKVTSKTQAHGKAEAAAATKQSETTPRSKTGPSVPIHSKRFGLPPKGESLSTPTNGSQGSFRPLASTASKASMDLLPSLPFQDPSTQQTISLYEALSSALGNHQEEEAPYSLKPTAAYTATHTSQASSHFVPAYSNAMTHTGLSRPHSEANETERRPFVGAYQSIHSDSNASFPISSLPMPYERPSESSRHSTPSSRSVPPSAPFKPPSAAHASPHMQALSLSAAIEELKLSTGAPTRGNNDDTFVSASLSPFKKRSILSDPKSRSVSPISRATSGFAPAEGELPLLESYVQQPPIRETGSGIETHKEGSVLESAAGATLNKKVDAAADFPYSNEEGVWWIPHSKVSKAILEKPYDASSTAFAAPTTVVMEDSKNGRNAATNRRPTELSMEDVATKVAGHLRRLERVEKTQEYLFGASSNSGTRSVVSQPPQPSFSYTLCEGRVGKRSKTPLSVPLNRLNAQGTANSVAHYGDVSPRLLKGIQTSEYESLNDVEKPNLWYFRDHTGPIELPASVTNGIEGTASPFHIPRTGQNLGWNSMKKPSSSSSSSSSLDTVNGLIPSATETTHLPQQELLRAVASNATPNATKSDRPIENGYNLNTSQEPFALDWIYAAPSFQTSTSVKPPVLSDSMKTANRLLPNVPFSLRLDGSSEAVGRYRNRSSVISDISAFDGGYRSSVTVEEPPPVSKREGERTLTSTHMNTVMNGHSNRVGRLSDTAFNIENIESELMYSQSPLEDGFGKFQNFSNPMLL